MKKKVLYLVVLVLTGLSAKGQIVKNWEKSAGASYSWFATTGANVNSCAYNPVTNKLYVANRDNDIYIIDPATQLQTGTLSKTGVSLSLAFHKVRVTSSGEIFAVSVRTSTAHGNSFIYYWANESAAPVLLGNPTTGITLAFERTGDSFGLSGSGDNVVLYLGGSGTSNISVISKVSGSFVLANTIALPNVVNPGTAAGSARSSISPVSTGLASDIWISGATMSKRKISSTGTLIKSLADGILVGGAYTATNAISNKFASLEYFEVGAKSYLAATGANDNPATGEGLAFHIYDITNINDVKLVANSKLTNAYKANGGPTSDIAINKIANQDGSFTVNFFQLVNHNGLASYTLSFKADGTLPVSLVSFNASVKNGESTLSWLTTSESNNKGFEIQRSIDGKEFTTISFEKSKAINGNSSSVINYSFVDKTAENGTNYYRLKQVDLNGDSKYYEVKVVDVGVVSANVQVYPNPVTAYVKIKAADFAGLEYKIYDSSGKVLIAEKATKEEIQLSTVSWSPSLYILRIFKGVEEIKAIKIIKQ
jgi:hypothetical protein